MGDKRIKLQIMLKYLSFDHETRSTLDLRAALGKAHICEHMEVLCSGMFPDVTK